MKMDATHQKNGWANLSLRQMGYALAAADHGNVTAAARALNISQPAISAAIAALEDHYGTPLFARRPGQGMAPSRFGTAVFAEIRSVLNQARAVAAMSEEQRAPAGELELGIYQALAPYYLPAILTCLNAALPELEVRFFEATLDELADRLRAGRADLCLTYDVGLDDTLSSETLYELRPFILAPHRHPLARRRSAPLSALAREPLVLLDQEASAAYVLGLLAAHGVKPAKLLRAQSFELQRSLVANGLGLALSHTRPLTGRAYDGKPLLTVPVSTPLGTQRVLLAWPARHRRTRQAEAAASLIRNLFKTLPPATIDRQILITRKKRA